MDKNEIKKALYKEKPEAWLDSETEDGLNYYAMVDGIGIHFFVPIADIGTSRHRFEDKMQSQLLIRWMVQKN